MFSFPTKTISFFLVFLFLGGAHVEAASKSKKEGVVQGYLTSRYKFRTTGDVSDHDLEEILSLSFGNPIYDKVTGSLQGAAIADLNGADSNNAFTGINNTYSHDVIGRLYHAYVNVSRIDPIDSLRVGRQHLQNIESFYFDGASFETVPFAGFVISGFGGIPVHLYEDQLGDDIGDWVAGGALQWTPVHTVRLKFDYSYIQDQAVGFRLSQGDQQDALMGSSIWVDFSKHFNVFAKLTSFSDELKDATMAATILSSEKSLTIRFQAYRLLESYDIRVGDWDAMNFAGAYQPYSEFGANLTKGLGKKFSVDIGGSRRILDDAQNASAFNHGYSRGYFSLLSHNFLIDGLDLNTVLDYYHGEDNSLQNNTFGGSFSASQALFKKSKKLKTKEMKVTVGTAYYLYRYNLLTGDESDDVQTYFADFGTKVGKNVKIVSRYEFEHNDLNGFHTGTVRLIWNF